MTRETKEDGKRIISISPEPAPSLPIPVTGAITLRGGLWTDRLGRPFEDLRISVTDHCNFRCRYCKPREIWDDFKAYLPREELLTFEEITRFVKICAARGIRKVRLTGGEPLLRRGIEDLVARLSEIRNSRGEALEIALTTNGSLLRRKAKALKQAGLSRVTVSLDAIDEAIFQAFNDVGFPVAKVLDGIDAAIEAGFTGTKVNTVVKKGVNEDQTVPLLEHFQGTGISVRFIEYMDAGSSNGWRMDDVVTAGQILERVKSRFEVVPLAPRHPSDTAKRWRYGPGDDVFGCICSVSMPFCRHCTRLRLALNGTAYLCLFAENGVDLRTLFRGGASDTEIDEAVGRIWSARENRYSELRQSGIPLPRKKVEMSYIGG